MNAISRIGCYAEAQSIRSLSRMQAALVRVIAEMGDIEEPLSSETWVDTPADLVARLREEVDGLQWQIDRLKGVEA